MALKTGMAIVTLLVEHICRVLNAYRPAMNAVITAAVGAGTITTVQKDIIYTWLDGAQAACAILKSITGY